MDMWGTGNDQWRCQSTPPYRPIAPWHGLKGSCIPHTEEYNPHRICDNRGDGSAGPIRPCLQPLQECTFPNSTEQREALLDYLCREGESVYIWKTPGYRIMLSSFLKVLQDGPFLYWPTFTLGTTKWCCTRIAGTIWPSRLHNACFGWPESYRELPVQYQYFSEYLGKYWMLTWDQSPKCSSTRLVWNAWSADTEKRRWERCPEFEGFLWNTSRTSLMNLLIWRELEPRCPERNQTGAGSGFK